jgi:hypothetical protein
MPILRRRVHDYTKTWNIHSIRAQPNRPNVIPGKPFMNYYHADIDDYRQQFDHDRLRELQEDVAEWDPSAYLPQATLSWCRIQLHEIGRQLVGAPFNPEDPLIQLYGQRFQPYRVVYEALRLRAIEHVQSGQQPTLEICEKPHGAHTWSPGAATPETPGR